MRFSRAFNIQTDPRDVAAIYGRAFADMTRRAVHEGVGHVLGEWTDNFRLPSPGIIRRDTDPMVIAWTSEMNALRVALRLMGQPQLPRYSERQDDATPEFRAETKRIYDEAMSELKSRSRVFRR